MTLSALERCNEARNRQGYGVTTISRLLKIIGLFCRISSLLYGSFAKETYDFKEPTTRSNPISLSPAPLVGQDLVRVDFYDAYSIIKPSRLLKYCFFQQGTVQE